jgi:L-aspartate oxidase
MPTDTAYRTIVIGSGISGLFVALEARKLGPVLVLTKGSIDDCNTRWAQGGIAAAIGPLDSPARHLADTIEAGAGLVDEEAARVLCFEAPGRIADLVRYGVAFDSLGSEVALGREAAHSYARILHAGGDRTGAEIERALGSAVSEPGITVLDFSLATSVETAGGRVVGVSAIDLRTGRGESFSAPAVVLATGGAGHLFSHTTNPDVATGDGIALALQAGAEVADLEFYQFHPTALRLPGAPAFLISEAIRGDGAIIRDVGGEAFMRRYHELAELAPRDVVARAIVSEMRRTGSDHVLLDCTAIHGVDLRVRFPGVSAFCLEHGIDIRSSPIPIAPAAHYFMGGVRTDVYGRTTIEGLYACGEVACTGVHGANRLASNSLMETVVFGKRVAEHIASGNGGQAQRSRDATNWVDNGGPAPSHAAMQSLMWDAAGIERDGPGLSGALATAEAWPITRDVRGDRESTERVQMATVARLMLRAALDRTESRGAHYRSDYPKRDDAHWRRRLAYRRAD